MKAVFDTFAWIAYFEGSAAGERVRPLLEDDDESDIITPTVVLAELSDTIERGRLKEEWEEVARFIAFNSRTCDIDFFISRQPVILLNSLRKTHPDTSLIDAIVLATARQEGASLYTGDSHLTGEKDVIDLRKEE